MPTGAQEGIHNTLDGSFRSNEPTFSCTQCTARRMTYLIIGGCTLFLAGLAMIIVYRHKLNVPEKSALFREPHNPLGVTAIVCLVVGVVLVVGGRIGYMIRRYCKDDEEGVIEDEETILPSDRMVQVTTSSYIRNVPVSRSSRVNSLPVHFTPPPSYTTIYPEPPTWLLVNGHSSLRNSTSTNCDRRDVEEKEVKEQWEKRGVYEEPPPSYSGLFPD